MFATTEYDPSVSLKNEPVGGVEEGADNVLKGTREPVRLDRVILVRQLALCARQRCLCQQLERLEESDVSAGRNGDEGLKVRRRAPTARRCTADTVANVPRSSCWQRGARFPNQ